MIMDALETIWLAVLIVLAAAIVLLLLSWVVMLLVGIAHGIEPAIPPIGFDLTAVLVAAARVALVQNGKTS